LRRVKSRGLRRHVAFAAAAWIVAAGAGAARADHDPFAWVPPHSVAAETGRDVGARFEMLDLHELSVELDDAYSAANRQALAIAEERLAETPGVRVMFGPSTLVRISVDAAGNASARPMLDRGDTERASELARQDVVRRADVLGWFLSESGRRARFYVAADDWAATEPKLASAIIGSGLAISGPDSIASRPLWPDPRWHRARFLPLGFAAGWVFFVLVAASRAGFRPGRRRLACALVAASGAAGPFVLMPVAGVRLIGGLAAMGAAAVAAVFVQGSRVPSGATAQAPRFFVVVALLAAALVLEIGLAAPRIHVETQQWGMAPMMFVGVRADMDQPVVLRELRRLTEFVRQQGGVAAAWSVADVFAGTTFEAEDALEIPPNPADVRRILLQAQRDPAVRLELTPDHAAGLVAIRIDDDPGVDRMALLARVERYVRDDWRPSLVPVDLTSGKVSPATRLFGQGMLTADAHERVVRACAAAGRPLPAGAMNAVDRTLRTATLLPNVDLGALETELGDAVHDFVAHHPVPLAQAQIDRLQAAADAFAADPASINLQAAALAIYGRRMSGPALRATTTGFERRLGAVRRHHIARNNLRDVMAALGMPNDGHLAETVRAATLEAMGTTVGVPAEPGAKDALPLAAVVVGGAANDRTLSAGWRRALVAGLLANAAILAVVLVLVGGRAGIAALPIGYAPLAAAAAPAAILGTPIGLPTLSFFCGALAGGAVLAVLAAPPRNRRRPGDRR
jgi:hypothetical protein